MIENNGTHPRKINTELLEIIIVLLAIFLVYLTRLYSYLLFHSIAELFSIIIAGGIFLVGWNSRKYMNNSFFLVLGVSSLFIAVIDLIHTLAYSGMNIFTGYDANLPTSLWIAARYLQAGSCLFASLLIKKTLQPIYLFITYLSVALILVFLIFATLFPVCYIVGVGLTPFKIVSEYIIDIILLVCLLIIIKNRTEFDKKVFSLMISSILATMIAELAFTFYFGVTELPNFIGHIFKIIAFYLLYKAIIQIGIEEPFGLLFRKIKRSELELKNIIEHSGVGITMVDENGVYLLVNEKAAENLGGNLENFIGKTLNDVFPEKIANEYLISNRELIRDEICRSYQRTFDLPSGEKTFWIVEQPLKDIDGKNPSLLSVSTDITEKIKSESLLQEAELRYRTTFEQSPDGIVILDPETFKAVEFNDVVCNILGYSRDEFQKLQINDYDITENTEETKAHVEKISKEGRDDFETKFRRKNGEIIDVFVTAKVIK
ncbi:MAG: PAS domain S-box protein, partial [Candidatus Lokiarchaeota archaeon]|nr:PAS domain S-box protein [Candidatus Lokiarchaeota archaeon]